MTMKEGMKEGIIKSKGREERKKERGMAPLTLTIVREARLLISTLRKAKYVASYSWDRLRG